MAGFNSLLFLLTTISPFTEPPSEDATVPFDKSYEWHRSLHPANMDTFEVPELACKENEWFDDCNGNPICQSNCWNYDKPIPCPPMCVKGCVCKDPMVRGPDGECVSIDRCPVTSMQEKEDTGSNSDTPCFPMVPPSGPFNCPPREHYQRCGTFCPADCYGSSCPYNCCVEGCFCNSGFIRGPNGTCVTQEECPMNRKTQGSTNGGMCGPDTEFTLCLGDPLCQRSCFNLGERIHCVAICSMGCICKEPLILGPYWNCVLPQNCPNARTVSRTNCQLYEEWSECDAVPSCQRNCTNYDDPIICPKMCIPGCVCKAPRVRGPDGRCVTPRECPALEADSSHRTCKPDEEWSYCDRNPRCERNCLNYGTIQSCLQNCTEGCVCKKGTIRGPGGKCILPQQCPQMQSVPVPVCKPNEEFSECSGNPICQKSCANYDDPISCPYVCHPGCVCKNSTIRGPDGECIPIDQCPTNTSQLSVRLCKSNELFTPCYGNPRCEQTCSNYNKPTPCPPICIPGCMCTLPMIRGPGGECIHPDKCPEISEISAPKCKTDQEFSICAANPICQRNCVNYMHPVICPILCTPGCVCKKSLVIGPDGECIHPDQCPSNLNVTKPQCSSDEEFSHCEANPFCQKTCLTYKLEMRCPDDCHPGCVCKAPLIRDSYGKCKHPDECLALRHENQQNSYSDEDASASSSETILAPQISMPSCPRNEEFSNCYAHCQQNCSNYMKPRYCPLNCFSGCVCKKSMVRGPDGRCIYSDDCPATLIDNLLNLDFEMSEKDIENQLSEQISDSQDQDFEMSLKDIEDQLSEQISGSQGQDNLLNLNFEMSEKDIEDQLSGQMSGSQGQEHLFKCMTNAVYKSCPSACPDNCRNFRRPYRSCKSICLPGMRCECKDGFVEGPTGSCITPDQCPGYPNYEMTENEVDDELLAPQGQFFSCKKNEVYKVCPSSCPDNCDNFQDTFRPCKLICLPIPKCECKSGFVKGPDGSCIKPDQCPSHEKKPEDCTELEYYDTCGTACEDNCTNYDQEDRTCAKKCIVGCFCLPGYVRGHKGECMWPFDCWGPNSPQRMDSTSNKQDTRYLENSNGRLVLDMPRLSCKKANEEYSFTSSICPDTCDNYKNPRRACNFIRIPGCKCSDGYVRNKSGDCIRIEQCLDDGKSCPEHEEYLECGTACPRNCTNYDKNETCIELCVSGCFCKEPLIRGPDGKCIYRDDCPQTLEAPQGGPFDLNVLPGMCKKNEEFSFLRSLCPDTCENYNYPERSCSIFKLPGCQCKEGYVFERSGICIRKEQCVEERPEDCTEMEFFDHCGSYCEADCTNYNYNVDMCEDHRCKKGCFCKPGYVRAPDWTCVLPLDCPRRQVSNSF